ncbi:hypothetical protein ABVV53_04330 [Novosphingobium sp. RD2P27]|uniref:Uncharacterized protein n=1 Tax=Novosphingobium kalidii TaxID=3230299 RepID=A0ABV2CYK6_9SPHN
MALPKLFPSRSNQLNLPMPDYLWLLCAQAQLPEAMLLFLVAWMRGAAPERLLSGALLVFLTLWTIYDLILDAPGALEQVDPVRLLLDALMGGVVVSIALYANRIYPVWMSGAQLAALSAHFARATLVNLPPAAYMAMTQFPNYIHMLVLALGLCAHTIRKRRVGGSYPNWSD